MNQGAGGGVGEAERPDALERDGRVIRKATTPDHRCTGPAQDGDPFTPGSRPHMASALITWTTTRTSAAVVSQVFIASSVPKPNVAIAAPFPGWTVE